MNKLEKYYDIFSTKERINLSLAALARGDDEEFLKLKNNCPMLNYKMRDTNYITGMERITLICIAYADLYDSHNNKVFVCYLLAAANDDLISAYEDGFNLASEDLGCDHKPSKKTITKKARAIKKYESLIDKMTDCFYKKIAEVKAIHEAFKLFCEKAGINYQYAYDLAKQASSFELSNSFNFEDVGIDMEFKEYIEQIFLKFWNN